MKLEENMSGRNLSPCCTDNDHDLCGDDPTCECNCHTKKALSDTRLQEIYLSPDSVVDGLRAVYEAGRESGQKSVLEWPSAFPIVDPTPLGTSHLPDEVVSQDLVIGVWALTNPDNPRQGRGSIGFTLGGRNNPRLTEDEKEYVKANLEWAIGKITQFGLEH